MRRMKAGVSIAAVLMVGLADAHAEYVPSARTGGTTLIFEEGSSRMSENDTTKTPAITRINPPALWNGDGLSQISVVESGRLAFLSGQVAWRAGDQVVPDDLAQQAELASDNIDHALKALNATPQDIVMIRFYVANGTSERLGEVWPVLVRRFGSVRPSVTALGVTALATPDLQVEVEVVVRLP